MNIIGIFFQNVWVQILLNARKIKTLGFLNIISERQLPAERKELPVLLPFDKEIIHKKWIVILDTGQVGVIDHIKSDGRLGVRPVDPITAAYLPNSANHWSWEDRIRIPQEISIPTGRVRAANKDEIPYIVRKSL